MVLIFGDLIPVYSEKEKLFGGALVLPNSFKPLIMKTPCTKNTNIVIFHIF